MRIVLLVLVSVLLLSGCLGDKREPVPTYLVTIGADPNAYRLDGMPMSLDGLHTELSDIAAKHRRSDRSARAYVRIASDPGADYQRTVDLIDWCSTVGLDKIEQISR